MLNSRQLLSLKDASVPTAVILGSAANGLSFVRSLSRKGVPVICADRYAGLATCSRFGTFVKLDEVEGEKIKGGGAADTLFDQLDEAGVEVVALGTADEWQVYIAQRAAAGRPRFNSLLPGADTVALIDDKQAQYESAVALGVPVPEFANAEEVRAGRVHWKTFPAIIKPRWTHIGCGVIGGKALAVADPAELREKLCWLSSIAVTETFLVQRVIQGGDDSLFGYLGCFDKQGQEIAYVLKQKLRQHPPLFGDGSLDVTSDADELRAMAKLLLTAMSYRGLVGIEFKKSDADGSFFLIEINARSVSTNQIAISAGVDFPWLAYRLSRGKTIDALFLGDGAPRPYEVGIHHVHEVRELRGFYERWRKGEFTLGQWLASVLGAESYALWDRRDPHPFFSAMSRVVLRKLGKMLYGVNGASTRGTN
jgi:D-aspartate ligase